MPIFAISFIILGHVSSVGKILLPSFFFLVFPKQLFVLLEFLKFKTFDIEPLSVEQRAVIHWRGYGSEIVDIVIAKNLVCQ